MNVIIVDDGLASGYTMLRPYLNKKALFCKDYGCRSNSLKNAIELVSPYVDELFCLNIRETSIFAVADAYQEWRDLTEHEVWNC